ncbi:hypothetical protein [Sphingomonas jaspsi]|uniref:hypothetical protein n=1 Tax=Sphingomonas jaspsi TaxID=392409 RepID=UPI0004B4087F|nr:hypothetical protein [Sphingomonas jaspsi]
MTQYEQLSNEDLADQLRAAADADIYVDTTLAGRGEDEAATYDDAIERLQQLVMEAERRLRLGVGR